MGAAFARGVRIVLMIGLGLLAIFAELAPLGHHSEAQPSPDLLFLVVAFFSVRRPGTAWLLIVFALGLTRDLLADAPVGAGALSLVLASEALKSLNPRLRRSSIALEILVVGLAAGIMLFVQWLAVLLTFLPPPPANQLIQQWLVTAAIYPLLALVFRWLLGIGWRKTAAET